MDGVHDRHIKTSDRFLTSPYPFPSCSYPHIAPFTADPSMAAFAFAVIALGTSAAYPRR